MPFVSVHCRTVFYRVVSPLRYEFLYTDRIGFYCTINFYISHLCEFPHLDRIYSTPCMKDA
jgi:hypothetical protein